MNLLQNNHEAKLLELYVFRIAFSIAFCINWVCAYYCISISLYILLLSIPILVFLIETHHSRLKTGASRLMVHVVLLRACVFCLSVAVFEIIFYFAEMRQMMNYLALGTSGIAFVVFFIQRIVYKEKTYSDSYSVKSEEEKKWDMSENGIPDSRKTNMYV